MALDFYSKHGIIVAIVTIFGSLYMGLTETHRVASILRSDDFFQSFPVRYKVESALTYICIMLAGVLSPVLIFGIVKKRHSLVAPWLVIGFLLSSFYCVNIIYDTVITPYFHLESCVLIVLVIGVEIIALYPMCQLFSEIRRGNAAVGKPKVVPI